MALGFNLDLLPTVLSAANGKLGYAPQVWLGILPLPVSALAVSPFANYFLAVPKL